MKINADYHIHTDSSDGKNTAQEIISAALSAGLKEIAFTDHSFSSFMYHQTPEKLTAQANLARGENRIKVRCSIEGNLIGFDGRLDIGAEVIKKLDILHVGFHRFVTRYTKGDLFPFILRNGFGSKNQSAELAEKNTSAYIKAMETYPVDVLCHLGHRASVDMKKIAECAKSNDVYIELNEKHIDAIEPMIETAKSVGVKFILGSDSHKKSAVGQFENAVKLIEKYDIPHDSVVGLEAEPLFKVK